MSYHKHCFSEAYNSIAKTLNVDVVEADVLISIFLYNRGALFGMYNEAVLVRQVCNRLNIKTNYNAIRNYLNH